MVIACAHRRCKRKHAIFSTLSISAVVTSVLLAGSAAAAVAATAAAAATPPGPTTAPDLDASPPGVLDIAVKEELHIQGRLEATSSAAAQTLELHDESSGVWYVLRWRKHEGSGPLLDEQTGRPIPLGSKVTLTCYSAPLLPSDSAFTRICHRVAHATVVNKLSSAAVDTPPAADAGAYAPPAGMEAEGPQETVVTPGQQDTKTGADATAPTGMPASPAAPTTTTTTPRPPRPTPLPVDTPPTTSMPAPANTTLAPTPLPNNTVGGDSKANTVTTPAAPNGTATATSPTDSTKVGAVASPPGATATAADATASMTINWLILLVNVLPGSCTASRAAPGTTATAVSRRLWDAATGYATYWSDCSHGRYTMQKQQTRVLSITISCSNATMISNCQHRDIAALADVEARRKLGEAAYNTFITEPLGRKTYLLPKGMLAACAWTGIATTPGAINWLTTDPNNGINSPYTTFHESLHNLGLDHATYGGYEYGDESSVMGSGTGCPNAPEMRRLNWATPAADHSAVDLPPNVYRGYSLPAQYLQPEGTFIRITPSWLDQPAAPHVYVSYRYRARGDSALAAKFHQAVVVHQMANVEVDDDPSNPNIVSTTGTTSTELLAWGGLGQVIDLPAFKLAVRLNGYLDTDGTEAAVWVCRYATNSSSCKYGEVRSPPPPPPAVPPKVSWEAMGCYRDNGAERTVPMALGAPARRVSVATCAARAQAAGLRVFALQVIRAKRKQCYGGTSVQDAAQLGQSTACKACPGNRSNMCGGVGANSVYVLTGMCGGGYFGCFREGVPMAMPDTLNYGGDYNMTFQRCQEGARQAGAPYFGLAAGNQCWFGSSLRGAVQHGVSSGCSRPCSGSANEVCGGAGETLFGLYKTDTCTGPNNQTLPARCTPGACSAYTSTPECVTVPQYGPTAGVWAGRCIARLPGFGDGTEVARLR